jgi:hypothetical protein
MMWAAGGTGWITESTLAAWRGGGGSCRGLGGRYADEERCRSRQGVCASKTRSSCVLGRRENVAVPPGLSTRCGTPCEEGRVEGACDICR